MKSIICLIVLLSLQAFAQESQVNLPDATLTAEAPETAKESVLHGFGLSLNTLPIPLLSQGIGGAIDYQIGKGFSIAYILEREANNSLDSHLKNEVSTLFTNRTILMKYALAANNQKDGFYLSAGYKWSDIETGLDLFLFTLAKKKEKSQGPVAGIGYRLILSKKEYFSFHADAGINYEPGAVLKTSYNESLFVPEDQYIKTKIGYGLFPEVRITATFQ